MGAFLCCKFQDVYSVELGSTQILEMVRYFIKYHGINSHYDILINTFMYPVKYINNFSQVTSVRYKSSAKNQIQEQN